MDTILETETPMSPCSIPNELRSFNFDLAVVLIPSFAGPITTKRTCGANSWRHMSVPQRVYELEVEAQLNSIRVYTVHRNSYRSGNLQAHVSYLYTIEPRDFEMFQASDVGVPLILASYMFQHHGIRPNAPIFGHISLSFRYDPRRRPRSMRRYLCPDVRQNHSDPEEETIEPQMMSLLGKDMQTDMSAFFRAGTDASMEICALTSNVNDRVLPKLVKACDSFEQAASTAKTCGASVTNVVDTVKDVDFLDIFCLVIDAFREFKCPTPLGVISLATRFCRNLPKVCYDFVLSHLESLVRYFFPVPVPQLDTTGDEMVIIPQAGCDIVSSFIGLIGTFLSRAIPSPKDIAYVVNSCKDFNIVASAIRNAESMMQWVISMLPECISAWICVLCPAKLWLKQYEELGVANWLTAVDAMCIEQNKLLIVHDTSKQLAVKALVDQGKRILDVFVNLKNVSPAYTSYVMRKYDKVNDFYNAFLFAAGLLASNRRVPYTIYLAGAPGIGKSTLIPYITRMLAPKDLPENLRCYSRSSGEPFWDRYMGQFFAILDDICQRADGEDAMEWIKMINSIPYILPMASLGDPVVGVKGTLFTSQCVIMTSNLAWPTSNAIRNQEAAWRRRDRLYLVGVRPEYAGMRIEDIPTQVTKTFGHLFFQRANPIKSTDNPVNPIGFQEFMQDIKKSFDLHQGKLPINNSEAIDTLLRDIGIDIPIYEPPFVDALEEVVPETAIGNIKKQVHSFLEVHPFLKKIYDFVVGNAGFLALACAFLAWCCSPSKKLTPQMLSSSSGDMRVPSSTRIIRRLPQPVPQVTIAPQSDVAGQGLSEIILDHLYSLYVERDDGGATTVAAFCVWGRVFCFPMHALLSSTGTLPAEGTRMLFKHESGVTITQKFNKAAMTEMPCYDPEGRKRDLVAYRCDKAASCKRDRLSLFIKDLDLDVLDGSPASLYTCRAGVPQIYSIPEVNLGTIIVKYEVGSTKFATPHHIQYHLTTTVGDCGGVLFLDRPDMQRRLCGLHIGALNGRGHSDIITFEDLTWLRNQPGWGPTDQYVTILPECEATLSPFHPVGNFDLIGKAGPRNSVRLVDKTHIAPSLFYGELFRPETAPAVLRPSDPRLLSEFQGQSILRRAAEKSAAVGHSFSGPFLSEAGSYLDGVFRGGNHLKRVFTEKEAINGIVSEPYAESLVMQSSAGYGFKLPGSKGKYHLFEGEVPDRAISSPVLRKALDNRWSNLNSGVVSLTIWQDSLKDERLNRKKIEEGNTRMFSIPPVDHTIAVRRLFGGFCTYFYSRHMNSPSTVGIDAESGAWNSLACRLLEKGGFIFDADYKAFGPTVAPEVAFTVCDFINRWYNDGPEMARARIICFEESVHSLHLASDAFYIGHGGFPSGSPLTIVLNTLVNMCYVYCIYMEVVPLNFRNVSAFVEHLVFLCNGDDALFSRTPALAPHFNLRKFIERASWHGLTVTPGQKDSTDYDRDLNITEVAYLKRSFAFHEAYPGMYVARLKEVSIRELLNWVHDSGPVKEMSIQNALTALSFAYFYGHDFFSTFRYGVDRLFEDHGIVYPLPTFSEYVRMNLPKFYGDPEQSGHSRFDLIPQ